MIALVCSTMDSNWMPNHCGFANVHIQTKRFVGAPCAADAIISPHLFPQICDLSASINHKRESSHVTQTKS